MRHATLGICLIIAALLRPASAEERATPPVFSPGEEAIFFDEVSSVLKGARPTFQQQTPASVVPRASGDETAGASDDWSDLIAADTIENEIKRQAQRVAVATQSATRFKGGGYRDARQAFTTLAVMFRLAAEHPDRARWRDVGGGLATLLARAAANCKVGTDGSYREAAARSQDLADLVRGSRPDVPQPPADQLWSDLADRTPIMVRMEQAEQKGLGPLIGSGAAFKRGAEDAAHEAQVLAALAELLTRQDFPDYDSEDYAAYAERLREAATALSHAAGENNYEAARAALGDINKACSNCHDDYRG